MISNLISKCQIEFRHGLALHPRRDMGIDVHCDCDSGVAQPFLNHLGMDATRQQFRCMRMAQVVISNAREVPPPHQICELVG
jgi:hypothetical protein